MAEGGDGTQSLGWTRPGRPKDSDGPGPSGRGGQADGVGRGTQKEGRPGMGLGWTRSGRLGQGILMDPDLGAARA